jgi:hypothetical protein
MISGTWQCARSANAIQLLNKATGTATTAATAAERHEKGRARGIRAAHPHSLLVQLSQYRHVQPSIAWRISHMR